VLTSLRLPWWRSNLAVEAFDALPAAGNRRFRLRRPFRGPTQEQIERELEYTTKTGALGGIVAVQRDAPGGDVVEDPTWLKLVSARLAVDGVEGCAEVVG